jgi:hypothetical protein
MRYLMIAFLGVFLSFAIHAQSKSDTLKVKHKLSKFNTSVEIKMNETAYFADSLNVQLNYFSHKRPYTGGATKATAYCTISKGKKNEEIMLSIHGTDGKPGIEAYDTIEDWHGYKLELKEFNYDSSIHIIVSKNK